MRLIQMNKSNIIYEFHIIIHVNVLQFLCQPPTNTRTMKQTRITPCSLISWHGKQNSVIKTRRTHDRIGLEGWMIDELFAHIPNESPPLISVWVKHLNHHSTSNNISSHFLILLFFHSYPPLCSSHSLCTKFSFFHKLGHRQQLSFRKIKILPGIPVIFFWQTISSHNSS